VTRRDLRKSLHMNPTAKPLASLVFWMPLVVAVTSMVPVIAATAAEKADAAEQTSSEAEAPSEDSPAAPQDSPAESATAERERGDESPSERTIPDRRSIMEQRRAIMRGEAAGRTAVPVRKSSAADIAKGDITFDDLKFDIEKGEPFDREKLTEVIRSLNGRKVQLRGYILPSTLFRETDIEQFVLVRDNQECCFGPGAALFDCVMIEMVPGKTTDFVTRPVTVEGKFVIDDEKYRYPGGRGPDGSSHLSVFRIEGIRVR